MAFVVKKQMITEPHQAVDGKRHVRTLYYSGRADAVLSGATYWNTGLNSAIRFYHKRAAERFAKKHDAEVVKVN